MSYFLLLCLFCGVFAAKLVAGGSWLLGCYYVNQTADTGSLLDGVSVRLKTGSVVECGEECLEAGYDYIGLHSPHRCSCYNVSTLETLLQDGLLEIQPNYCNISCNSSGLLLPCGGSSVGYHPVSLYLSAGPYLTHLSLNIDADWVVRDTPFAIEALAVLAGYVNITNGLSNTSKSGLELSVTWTVGDNRHTETIDAWGPTIKSRVPYTFYQPGNYTVQVQVSNVISSLTTSIQVTVINPEPKDLQLAVLTGEDYRPSCTPKECDIRPGMVTVAVFVNYTSSIEASVSVGANLTFVLEFGDDGNTYTYQPSEETPQCEERNCTAVVQEHVFTETGVYNVTVTVSNVYNSVQAVMTVVVLNHKLSNLSMRLLDSDAPRLVLPLQPVTFLLKIETASRRDTFVELYIGNNNTRLFSVTEFNTSALVLSDPDRATIAASYGVGCTLEVKLDHVFKSEGVYKPVVTAHNNVSTITTALPDEIVAMNKIIGPKLHTFSIASLKIPATYHVDFDVKSRNMSITWRVTTRNSTLIHVAENALQTWSYNFTAQGHYVVSVTAVNLQGNVSASAAVYVQVPVRSLTLENPPQFYAVMGHTLSLNARIDSGSDVTFLWNFDDVTSTSDIVSKTMSSQANHTFYSPGKYNISVIAVNNVSRQVVYLPELFVVQQRVTFVVLQSTDPTVLGNATIFLSMFDRGTDVNFDFDFGEGRSAGKGEYRKNLRKYFVTHTFQTAGIHVVKVFAYNLVSEVTSQIDVIVEEPVPEFTIEVVGPLLVNRSAVFAAMRGGDVIRRPDLIYTWFVGNSGSPTVKTRSPLLHWTFTEEGLYNVSLEAANRLKLLSAHFTVGVGRAEKEFSVTQDPELLSLNHCGVVQINTPCAFAIQGNLSGVDNVTVQYRNELSGPEEGTVDPRGWRFVLKESGLHRVFVRGHRDGISGGTQQFELSSFFIVEDPILGLQLKGPQVVSLQSLPRRYVWEALLEQGSHIVYVWALGNNRSLPTTYKEYAQRFIERGTYVLFLELFNDVSRDMANLTIVAQHPIVDLDITAQAVVLNVTTNITLRVEGGRNFWVSINFGDDNEAVLSSEYKGLEIVSFPAGDAELTVPIHHVIIGHTYAAVGEYAISVNVSNRLSWRNVSKVARVEEPITGLVITSDTTPVLRVGESVEVLVTVATGNDLNFRWNFTDGHDSTVQSDANSSLATHTFSITGTFAVSVAVSNPYVRAPLIVRLPYLVQVVQEIVDVQLQMANAAELIERHGYWSTDDNIFTGECYKCSHVTFHFDFGDGTSESVAGDEMLLASGMSGEVTHRYTAVGVYWVKVTAINLLNNLTSERQRLWVQVAPKGLRLDQVTYKTRFGNDTHFYGSIEQGTNVTFDWKFGDDQEELNAGPNVTHRYMDRGNFTMSVTARNRVYSLEQVRKVYVQYLIQGVDMKVSSTLVAAGETVEFTAIPYPQEFAEDHNFVGYYTWKIDPYIAEDPLTVANQITYKYKSAGKSKRRVTVTVEAANFISNATSKPVDLYILAKVSLLQMHFSGLPLLNNTLTFQMTTYSGSELTYTWDFGDGTPVVPGNSLTINHTFTRVGEFEVVGFVENVLSNSTVRKTLFIMDTLCLPPEISILPHLPGSRAKFEVERSKEVRIELEIHVNCSITQSTTYSWTLYNETTGERVHVGHLPASVFTERMLYFPPRTLEYGQYIVHLEVKINGTIVYSKVDITLVIVPSPLTSIISGGILRRISIHETVTLDGGQSHDPDLINATDLSYNWTCFRVKFPGSGCFGVNLTNVLDTNSSVLQFPGHYLSPNVTKEEFAFNLTVTKPGRESAIFTQTLQLADPDTLKALQITVNCPACMEGVVNSNQRLAMKAVCNNCDPTDEIVYVWTIHKIRMDDSSAASEAGAHCERAVQDDPPNSLNAGEQDPPEPEIPGLVTTTTSTKTTTTTVSPQTVKVTTAIPGMFIPKEGDSNGRSPHGRRRRGSEEPQDPLPVPLPQPGPEGNSDYVRHDLVQSGPAGPSEGDPNVMEEGQFVNNIMEGPAEGSGGSGGRTGSGGFRDPSSGRNTNKEEPPGVPVFDSGPKKPVHVKLLVELAKDPYNVDPEYLTTGYHKDVFVLKSGALRQGQRFIFEVNAHKKGEADLQGKSSVYVKVNRSPGRGVCTIPDSKTPSYELEQMFLVYCREWQDDGNGPLSYKVSYKLNSSDDEPFNNLIYRGLNTKIEFRLPAGHAPRHQVFVRIQISDNFGASTEACNLNLTVLPRELSYENGTLEQQLYNEVSRNDSRLGIFVSQKDYSNTRVFVNYLTLSLNRLAAQAPGSEVTRREVRYSLLHLLNSFPIRDEYELLQTIQPVLQLTKVIEELDTRSVKQATELLKQIAEKIQIIYKDKDYGQADLLRYVVEISSNVMAAARLARARNPDTVTTVPSKQYVSNSPRDASATSVTWVIGTVLQGQLETRYVGEEAIHWSSDYISVFANRYDTMKGPVIEMGEAKCSLPNDMSVILPAKSPTVALHEQAPFNLAGAPDENCYEAHMITFHENPFLMRMPEKKDFEVHSKVTSLKVMDCQGQEVKVGNLSKNNLVQIEIPQKEAEKDPLTSHTLNKWQMNVHQFNITEENFNKSLHIQVELAPVQVGRLFPIAVLISCGAPPLPEVHLHKTVFSIDRNNLPLYLPAGTFNVTGQCFLGLVDNNYNAGRPRSLDVREREYTLKTWWGQCLFWDSKQNRWSGEGCYTTANSTLNTTVCLCNHLTMFASRLDLVPNDLSFTNVEDFFELYKSAVMFTWITALFLMYLIAVIFCRRIDLHHARKGGAVYLQDNAITDHQKYEITLETGFRKGAGTTAKISVILHGEEGMSETRELISEDDRPLFERNSRDTFIMTLPDNIGRIWKVQLWHNNSGCSPSWYLSRVIIRDLSCWNTYYFICEKWLAVEEDEGKVEGEFMSLEGNLGFKKVFWAKGTQYATDFHLWASVVTCPSYSRFTRVQRLTCCLSLLMSYMCLNAMWYKDRVEQYRGEFGLLDLSWRSVVVGAIICAIVLPVNLFLVFLFRHSKVKKARPSKEDLYRAGKCEHLDESAEEPVQPVMTYSILDQSLLNWQSIQEWAQKQWVKRQQSEVSSSESVKNSPQIERTKKSEALEQASSGFGDCPSQDRFPPTVEAKKSNSSDKVSSQTSKSYSGVTTRRRQFFLPFWCAYVAWTLAVIIIVGCAVVTMMYGYRFGKTKSTLWLQSFYFSFMLCVFISHPLLIAILTLYTAIRYRCDPSIFDHRHEVCDEKRKSDSAKTKECVYCEECDELERGVAARQRSRYLRFARPPQEKQLIEARKKIMKEKKAYAVLQDYWQFLVFMVVLAIMAYGKDLSSPYYVNESLKNSLMRSGSPSFTRIRSIPDWWNWASSGFLDGLFTHVAYDRNSVTPTQTTNLYVIGHVHIRQLRVNSPVLCQSPTHSALLNTCHDNYATESRAEEPYGPNKTWRHSFYQQYYNLRGTHGTYDSSGYVVKLSKSRSEAYKQLSELHALDWLDVKTRAIVMELTIFYVPTSLFTSVALLVETPSTGGAFPHPSITSTYLYRYISVWDNLVLAAELFFILLVLYSVNAVIVQIITQRNKYISNPWNVLDVVFSLMALAYIGCYVYRFVLVYETKEHMLASYYEKFVDISTLAHWDEILKAMVGFLLALVTCKFLYLLRYKRTFSNLGNFYKRAYKELFVFTAMFLVFLLAYTSLGYAAFGVFSPHFKDFWVSLETMSGILTGCHTFPEFEMYSVIGSKFFLASYLMLVAGLLTCYVVAVLSYQYKIFRQGEMIAMGCSDTLRFFWERFLTWAGIKRPPPEDEPESDLPPEFTMAEIEYQVDELLFRMNAISGSSNLPEKPPCYFTDSDVTYGVGDDGISSGEGSETRPFDEERFEQRIQKIEENLYSQEPYLAQLIKLDSIGADVLTHEREKQLRSHLELEIFRRLQMQREQRLRSSDRSSSSGGSLSLPVHSSSRHASPVGGAANRKGAGHYTRLLKPVARSESSLLKLPDEYVLGSVEHPNLQTILAPNEDNVTDVSKDAGEDSAFPEHLILEALSRDYGLEFDPPKAKHKQVEKTKSSSTSGRSSTSDEWRHSRVEATTSSEDNTHVTGAGARAKIKHGGQPKVKPETATPSSAKVFSHSSLRDLPPIEITKTSIIGSPGSVKRKPPPGSFSLLNPQKQGPSGILLESSSGSEQDAYRGKRPASKARTLRKTKSRGKGKGGKRLPTLDSLEDDLSFENDGYNTDTMYGTTSSTSESSKDKSSSSENKQAWL